MFLYTHIVLTHREINLLGLCVCLYVCVHLCYVLVVCVHMCVHECVFVLVQTNMHATVYKSFNATI